MAKIINPNTALVMNTSNPVQNTYAQMNGIQPQYQVVLYVTDTNATHDPAFLSMFPMIAALPEKYTINLSASWDPPFGNKSMGDLYDQARPGAKQFMGASQGQILDTGATLLGVSTRNKWELAQTWQSSSPLSFTIDFVFNAITDTFRDIKQKHLALLKLVAPSEELAGMLQSPGPTVAGKGFGKGRYITLQLGTYLKMENMIVKSVSSDVTTLCGQDGIPHAMTVSVEFESFFAGITTQDLDKAFNYGK